MILILKIRKLKFVGGWSIIIVEVINTVDPGGLTIAIEAIIIEVIDIEVINTVDPGGSMIIIEAINVEAINTVDPGEDQWSL